MRISDWSSDVCSSDLSVTAFRSKSGVASVKLKSSPWPNQLPFQPLFHPSTSTPPKPFFAAKSIYCLVRAVVAPWLGPSAQLQGPDRKRVVRGKSVSVRVDLGGRRIIKKKKIQK